MVAIGASATTVRVTITSCGNTSDNINSLTLNGTVMMYAVFAAMQDFLKTRGMELNINAKATLAKLNLMMRNELEIKPLPLPRLLK